MQMRLRTYLPWIAAYAVLMSAGCFGLTMLRSRVIHVMSSPEESQRWHQWRNEAHQSGREGGVQRRMPKSDEPPALVLMRDYFGVVITATVLFGTVFYLVAMLLVRGMWSRGAAP